MTDFSLLPYTSTSATPILLNTHSLKKIPLLERAFQYQTMSSWFLFLKSSTHGSRLLVFKLVKERRKEHCRNARNVRKRKRVLSAYPCTGHCRKKTSSQDCRVASSFSKFDAAPACVKTEEGRQFVVNSVCYKFQRFSSQ